MRPTDKATADSCSVQSFAIIKNTGHGILLLAVFTLELEMDYPSETSLCTVARSPQTPLLRFFLAWGKGAAVHRLSGTDNPVFKSQADCSFKIKTILFQIKMHYLSDAKNQRITRLTRIILL